VARHREGLEKEEEELSMSDGRPSLFSRKNERLRQKGWVETPGSLNNALERRAREGRYQGFRVFG